MATSVVVVPRYVVRVETQDGKAVGGYFFMAYVSEYARLTADPYGKKPCYIPMEDGRVNILSIPWEELVFICETYDGRKPSEVSREECVFSLQKLQEWSCGNDISAAEAHPEAMFDEGEGV